MSLSLYGVPDGQKKEQSAWPCPSVYSPTTALGSLSSVALSSASAKATLTQRHKEAAIQRQFITHIWSGFLNEATNAISSGFLGEAIGVSKTDNKRLPGSSGRAFRLQAFFTSPLSAKRRLV